MKCIAHRGYSIKYKDNSIEAIREAIHREYDGIEIDVQICSTGELILHHDVYLGDSFVIDRTLEELKGEGICSLREVYDQVPDIKKTLLIVDIKGNNYNVIKALSTFYEKEPTRNVFFCSFNRKLLYGLPREFQKGTTVETVFTNEEYDMITQGLSVVVLHWTCLDHYFISYCKMKDIKVYTYTHKEDKELEYMYRYNVDGIITNGF
jgi:glycerophosphoryl diester phosphodiesterase